MTSLCKHDVCFNQPVFINTCSNIKFDTNYSNVDLGGLVVSVLATGPKVRS
jgi:hypothetical protein